MNYPNDPNNSENPNVPNSPNAPTPPHGPNIPHNKPNQPPFRPPFRPQPPRFWQIVLKDLAATIVGVTLFCVLSFSLFFGAIGVLATALSQPGSANYEVTETTIKGNERSAGKIVILPIEGIIQTDETGFIPKAINAIREDNRVRAVVLRVNSPGGTIAGSDYYLHLLKKLKADLEIPVVVSMGDLAASGGYYVSTAADKIFAERSTMTGSIGVIIPMYNAAELCKKIGVRSNAITSGAMKGMGDFMKEPTPEETAIWQKSVDESYEQFLDVIMSGRAYYRAEEDVEITRPTHEKLAGVRVKTIDKTADSEEPVLEEPTQEADAPDEEQTAEPASDETAHAEQDAPEGETLVQEEGAEEDAQEDQLDLKAQREAELRQLADGRIYSAKEAKELYLIDEIGFLDDAVAAAIEMTGLSDSNVHVVRYEEEKGLFDELMPKTVKADPLDKVVNTVSVPRGYYLCPRALP